VASFAVVLLFQKRFHGGLRDGSVTLTFRRWQKPHVKPGGRYRCHPLGVLEVDRVERVPLAGVTEEDARRAGFAGRADMLAHLGSGPAGPLGADEQVYRVELHHGGDGDRVTLALEDQLTAEDVAKLEARLRRLDERSEAGPWTAATLDIIVRRPRTAASQLAAELKREKLAFKADVVKLKKLGLTQSFEVGYEVSPRGRAFLAARRPPRRRR
jgi:hypothetical protein